METMPNIQARIVNYDRQGTQVTQQRFYEVTEVNGDYKWRQIKNVNAREMLAESMENTFNAVAGAEAVEPIVSAPVELVTLEDAEAAKAAEASRIAVAAGVTAVAAATTETPNGFFKRARNWYERNVSIKRLAGASATVMAVGALAFPQEGIHAAAAQEAASTTTTEAPATEVNPAVQAALNEMNSTLESLIERAEAPLSQAELEAIYGGESTGEHTAREIGFFNIDPANPEQSLQNLYSELRVNSDAQAFWNACLESGTPSYDVCVENPEVLARANALGTEYRAMTLEQKAETAEALIDRFETAEFNGITIDNGTYKTVAVGANGEFVPSSNTRYEDPRMNFTFTIDGTEYDVQMRSCVQITESETPTPLPPTPPAEQPPVTTPPEETTTTTTPPQETTTTTTPEETTTTTAPEETTTTTVRETTTTTEQGTTTTTAPEETTTTNVTLPKPDPTVPEGEVTTTVTVGEPTPPEPTTSTVAEAPTSSTAPVDTSVSTTAPEGPIDPMSIDTVTVSAQERAARTKGTFMAFASMATAVALGIGLPILSKRKIAKYQGKK